MDFVLRTLSTLRELPSLDFPHQHVEGFDRSTGELTQRLGGWIDQVSEQGRREMTTVLYSVLRHIERVQHYQCVKVTEPELPAVAKWASRANAILLYPDGTVRDPDGRLLVDRQGDQTDPDAQVPYPPDAKKRAAQNHLRLSERNIPSLEDLPPVAAESEVRLRPDDEVAWRALSLFIVAVRAESLASGNPIPVEKLEEKSPLAFQSLSPLEQAFLKSDSPDQQEVINFAWRYETLYVLQWALGLHSELKFADDICDVPLVAQTMVDNVDVELVSHAKLRGANEILDATDWNQRLLWAARQAAMEQKPPPAGIDGGVLSERQHALNWIVRFGDTAWDDVDTPT